MFNIKIALRKFQYDDIYHKLRWINDPLNNKYLHYDLPLEFEKTKEWFIKIRDLDNRYDAIIEVDGNPVGLIGLLSIDSRNKKAEFYICLGEMQYRGKGIAAYASRMLLDMAFNKLRLNRVYLYTEEENIAAQRLFERLGFQKEGLLVDDVYKDGMFANRFIMAITLTKYKLLWGESLD